ncbi:MAG: PEP/pyruvate-binding domain-containing protein [Chloroflexota bacterium]|nr:PEP/pyruvate-binding domain-containing protein [Chloroflexota bacterium]
MTLDQITAEDGPQVGSKALHLSELQEEGLRVPPGFVITTEAYRAFVAANELEDATDWSDRFDQAEVPGGVVEAIVEACRALRDQLSPSSDPLPLAVRSSATAEDLAQASFAGQYDTHLNLTSLEQILKGVRACWGSLWSERARAYRQKNGLSSAEVAMGVLVQQQIPADASGVLFTLNPTTGRERQMAVEAVWGLGEGLASGQITPDHYVVDGWDEGVVARQIADKGVMILPDEDGGVREVTVPSEDRQEPCLTDDQLLELARLGYKVQAIYGYPQDIEWALYDGEFYILQSRPLTSFTFDPDIGQWTSVNLREVLPGFVSVLSQSLSHDWEWSEAMQELFIRLRMMRKRREDARWTGLFFGHAYWNVGLAKKYAALIPGFEERAFDRTVGIEPTYEGKGRTTGYTPRSILRGLPILLALKRTYKEVLEEAQTYCEEFRRREEDFGQMDPSSLNDEELRAAVKRMLHIHFEANRIALLTTFLATQSQDDFQPMVDRLNEDYPGRRPIAMGRLLTGLSDVGTVKPLLGLWRLSRRAQSEPMLAEVIQEASLGELSQRLRSFPLQDRPFQDRPQGREFWAALEEYIETFRYMAPSDEDLACPRWDEDPTFVLRALKNFVAGGDEENPKERFELQKRIRELERKRAIARLSHGWLRFAPWRRSSFLSQLELVKEYCWWREETRVIASRAFYYCRKVLLEQGRRWADRGVLEEPEDIFWMEREHLLGLLEGKLGPSKVRDVVRKHRRTTVIYRNFTPPSAIVGRGGPERATRRLAARKFTGVACGSGQVTARAKVVHNLGEADKLKKGDILVAPYTNPGWTPLFSLASGIVMEEGGLLSHGAVVARECGIPTVLQIKDAVRIFQDGQLLRVDGDRGVVEIVEGATGDETSR